MYCTIILRSYSIWKIYLFGVSVVFWDFPLTVESYGGETSTLASSLHRQKPGFNSTNPYYEIHTFEFQD